ncbi:DNA polymerase-like protein [Tanacetum coccineum]
MKEYPMPCGKPVWYSNLEDMDIDSMLGFIEAYVVSVNYSEELKYAVGLGYKVVPISGYLFERKESPFKDFVRSLFLSRINPKSTITEVCNFKRYTDVVSFEGFIHGDMLIENNFIVSYHTNTGIDGTHWNPLKNSAIQVATAITTSTRIYMYSYISRDDCYYTDTDSVVLSQPFPEELISASILGMLNLEDQIMKGFFLARKAYSYYTLEGSTAINGGSKSVFTSSKKLSTSTYGYGCCKQAFCNCLPTMGQLQNLIQESRRVLNLFLRSVRTLDPDLKEARIRAARERIEDWRGGSKRCGRSKEDSFVRAVTRRGHRGDLNRRVADFSEIEICSVLSIKKRSLPPAFKNDEYESREGCRYYVSTLTPNRVFSVSLHSQSRRVPVGRDCLEMAVSCPPPVGNPIRVVALLALARPLGTFGRQGCVDKRTRIPFTPFHRAFFHQLQGLVPEIDCFAKRPHIIKAGFARRPSRSRVPNLASLL